MNFNAFFNAVIFGFFYKIFRVFLNITFKKFFNTSGLLYKSMALKDKLPLMSENEMLSLLATDGMLVKRPLLVGEDFVLTGFKEKEWEEKLVRK